MRLKRAKLLAAVSDKSLFRFVISLILLLGLVSWFCNRWPMEISIRQSFAAIGFSMPFMVVSVLTVGVRLSWLCGPPVSLKTGIGVNAVAQLVGLLLPSRISEAAKPVGLLLVCDVPLSRGFTVLTIERLIDAGVLALLILISTLFVSGPFNQQLAWSGIILAIIAIAGGGTVFMMGMYPGLLRGVSKKLSSRRLTLQIELLVGQLSQLAETRRIVVCLFLSVATWVFSYMVLLIFLFVALGSELTPLQVLVVFVASTLGLIVSVAPGGLGTFEAAVALSLIAFDIESSKAVAAAILLRVTLVLPVVALAVWHLSISPLRLRDVLKGVRNRDKK